MKSDLKETRKQMMELLGEAAQSLRLHAGGRCLSLV